MCWTKFRRVGWQPIADMLVAENGSQPPGLATGFCDLDMLLGGLKVGSLTILAGVRSMGASTLAIGIGTNVAEACPGGSRASRDGAVVGFFSLELSAGQLTSRMLLQEAVVASSHYRHRENEAEDLKRLEEAKRWLSTIPLFVDDTRWLTVGAIRKRARRLMRERGLGLIIIDNVHCLRDEVSGRKIGRQDASTVVHRLKSLAEELGVPVIALSQIPSHAVERREDKRPMLSDLDCSAEIELDADVVMLLHREEYYLTRSEPVRRMEESDREFGERYDRWRERLEQVHGTGEIFVALHRNGPTGKVTLRFNSEVPRFDNFLTVECPTD